MKHILVVILLIAVFKVSAQTKQATVSAHDSMANTISPMLGIPFGTIAKLEAEVVDGDGLRIKAFEGVYLLKINTVNGRVMHDTLVLPFTDETGSLASDNFELYQYVTGKTATSLPGADIEKMKKNYIGKKLVLMAYETGKFTGLPKDYSKYRPIKADRTFHFEHYLVVVANG